MPVDDFDDSEFDSPEEILERIHQSLEEHKKRKEKFFGLPTYLQNIMMAEGFVDKADVKRAFDVGYLSKEAQKDPQWKINGLGKKSIEMLRSWAFSKDDA